MFYLFLNQGNGIRLAHVENHYRCSMKRGLAEWQDEVRNNVFERRWRPGIRQMAMERKYQNDLEVGWAEDLEREQKERKPIFLAYLLMCHSEDKHLVWEREDEFICGQTEFCCLWATANVTC